MIFVNVLMVWYFVGQTRERATLAYIACRLHVLTSNWENKHETGLFILEKTFTKLDNWNVQDCKSFHMRNCLIPYRVFQHIRAILIFSSIHRFNNVDGYAWFSPLYIFKSQGFLLNWHYKNQIISGSQLNVEINLCSGASSSQIWTITS
jgi:hypothetical protein